MTTLTNVKTLSKIERLFVNVISVLPDGERQVDVDVKLFFSRLS
jgi:hypothetical protein